MQIENPDADQRPDEFTFCPSDGLIWSESNRQVFAELSAATLGTRPIVALIGPDGAGKSTLLAEWRAQCGTTFELAQVDALPTDPDAAMLEIARVLKIKSDAEDKSALIPAFREHLAGLAKDGKSAVLAIDNADGLAPNILELLRMLAGIKKAGRALLRLVLVGDEGLRDMLSTNARPGAGEQVRVLELKGLEAEAVERLARSVLVKEGRGDLEFAPGSLSALADATNALPGRVVERVREMAATATRHKHRRITADHVLGVTSTPVPEQPAETVSPDIAAENLSAAGRRMVGGNGDLPTSIRNAEDPRQLLRWAFNMPNGRADAPVDVPLPVQPPPPVPVREPPATGPALRRERPIADAAGDMPPGLGTALARLAEEEAAERAAIEAREAAAAVRAAQVSTDPLLTARAERQAQRHDEIESRGQTDAEPVPEPHDPMSRDGASDVELDLRRAFVETQLPHKKGRGLLMSGALAAAIVAGAFGWPILREALLADPSSPDVRTVVMTEGSTGGGGGNDALVLLDGPGPNHLDKITGLRPLADADVAGVEVLAEIEAFRPKLTMPEQLAILGQGQADPTIENRKTNLAVLEHIGFSTERSQEVVRAAEAEMASIKSATEAEVSEMAARLANATAEVAALDATARGLSDTASAREAELAALDSRIAAAQSREQELRRAIDRRENDLAAVEDATRSSLSDLEALRADIAAAEAERQQADAALASLRSEQQNLRDQVSDGGRLTEGLASQIAAAETRLEGLTAQAGALSADITRLQSERDEAAGALTQTRQALDTAENSLATVTQELDAAMADRDQLAVALADVSARKVAIEKEVTALDAARDAATGDLAAIRRDVQAAEAGLAAISAETAAAGAVAAERQAAAIKDFAAFDAERAAIEQEIAAIDADREKAARALTEAQAQVAAMVSELASRDGALARTEAKIVAASDELTSRQEALRLEAKSLAATVKSRDAAKAELAVLASRVQDQQAELRDLGELIEVRQFESAALTATLQNAEAAVASMKDELRQAEVLRDARIGDVARIEEQILQAETRLASLSDPAAPPMDEAATRPGAAPQDGAGFSAGAVTPETQAPVNDAPEVVVPLRSRNEASVLAALSKAPGLSKVSAADKDALAQQLMQGACVQDALRDVVGRINRYTLAALVRNLEKCSS